MYKIKAEQSFDSAHFLAGYQGKCSNIHGHRWRVEVEIATKELLQEGHSRGMIVDFERLKNDMKQVLEIYDHALILEKETMRKETLDCLMADGFKIVIVDFRTTAENFSRHFFEKIKALGYSVTRVLVHETPTNCAIYED